MWQQSIWSSEISRTTQWVSHSACCNLFTLLLCRFHKQNRRRIHHLTSRGVFSLCSRIVPSWSGLWYMSSAPVSRNGCASFACLVKGPTRVTTGSLAPCPEAFAPLLATGGWEAACERLNVMNLPKVLTCSWPNHVWEEQKNASWVKCILAWNWRISSVPWRRENAHSALHTECDQPGISESLGGLEQGFGRCWSGGNLAAEFLISGIYRLQSPRALGPMLDRYVGESMLSKNLPMAFQIVIPVK